MTAPIRTLGRATLVGALATAGCSLALAPSALAASVFAIAPATPDANGYFVLTAKPGAVIKRRVKITNVGDRPGTARIYAADATTGVTTGAVYLGADRQRRAVGAWIKLGESRARLAPGDSKITTFTVRVPETARGGQHLGGIVADNVSVSAGKRREKADSSFKVDIHHLTITAVQVELPGAPARRMSIDGLSSAGRRGYQSVVVDMANPGNQMIEPALDVRVEDESGDLALNRTTKLDTFLPDTRIDYPVPVVGKGLAAGTYDGTVVVRLGKKVLDRYTGSFEVSDEQVAQVFGDKAVPSTPGAGIPWKTILVSLLGMVLILLLVVAGRTLLRRRAEAAARAAERVRLAQEAEDRRLAGLERRERQASEREDAAAELARALEATEHGLALREGKHLARTHELETFDKTLDDREQAVAQREQSVEERELHLREREAQDSTRREELDQQERRLREREELHDGRRVAHETEAANRGRAVEEGEQRLRQREEEWSHTRRQREEADAAAHLALQDGERRLAESQEDFRRERAAARPTRNTRTFADRLRRRIGT